MPKMFISPSSQESNRYVTSNTEEEIMNRIADLLIPELVRHGIEVMRNSRGGTYADHVVQSNAYKPDIHLAIHSNARGSGTTTPIRGTEVYVYNPADLTSLGTRLGQEIYSRLSAITPSTDRGIKSGKDTMSEIRNTNAPAVLVETVYHDNLEDALWIVSHIQDVSDVLLLACLAQFGIQYIPKHTDLETALMKKVAWYESRFDRIKSIVYESVPN